MLDNHVLTRVARVAIRPFRFVDMTGGYASTALAAIGISEQAAAVGEAFGAVTNYSAPVEAAEAFAQGDLIKPAGDGTGRAVKGEAGNCCGRAMEASTAAGKIVEVRFLDGAAAGAVSGAGVPVTVNSRDANGRATSYTTGDNTYTVTYGQYGVATVSGGGQIATYNYDASGLLTGVTLS